MTSPVVAPRRARSRLLGLAVLLATFLAGALAGYAYERVTAHGKHRWQGGGRRTAALFSPDGPLGERLDLSAVQRRQIERILTEDRAKAHTAFREVRPQLKALFESTTASVRRELTPEQQAEFDRYVAERRKRLRKETR